MAANIVCFATTLKIFRIYNIFPVEGQELDPGNIFFVKFGSMCLLASTVLLGSGMHFIHSLKNNNYKYIYNDLTYVLAMLTAYSFIICFSINVRSAVNLFVFLSDFKTFGKPPKFDECNQQMNRFSRYHYIYILLCALTFLLVNELFKSSQCMKENRNYNISEVCGLVTKTWVPLDIDYFPIKQVYVVLQMFSVFYVCVGGGLVTWFVLEIVEHISVRIDHIKQLFVSALKEKDPEMLKAKFRRAVEYHNSLLNQEDDLNKTFSMAMFFMMLLGAAIMGSSACGYMKTGSNNLMVMCMGWFNGLILASVAGQRLINENMSIAEEIYNARWFDVGHILGKDILIVMARCRKPMKIRAAAFGVMDHAMIVTVSKAAYSYVSVLSTLSK